MHFSIYKQTREHPITQLATTENREILKSNQLNTIGHRTNQDLGSKRRGCSLVWLGHQPATLTTRVQIPATAPFSHIILARCLHWVFLYASALESPHAPCKECQTKAYEGQERQPRKRLLQSRCTQTLTRMSER
jgi:hypothetical protein